VPTSNTVSYTLIGQSHTATLNNVNGFNDHNNAAGACSATMSKTVNGGGSSSGGMTGIIIGVLVGVAAIASVVIGVFCYRRRKAAQVQVLERSMVNLSGAMELSGNPYCHSDKA
jgi:hypothetical protein